MLTWQEELQALIKLHGRRGCCVRLGRCSDESLKRWLEGFEPQSRYLSKIHTAYTEDFTDKELEEEDKNGNLKRIADSLDRIDRFLDFMLLRLRVMSADTALFDQMLRTCGLADVIPVSNGQRFTNETQR